MLRPSYSDLMEVLSENDNIVQNISSRYTIVVATARRARKIIDGAESLSKGTKDKPVTLAVKELYEGHIKILEAKPEIEKKHVYEHKFEPMMDLEHTDEY